VNIPDHMMRFRWIPGFKTQARHSSWMA